MLRNMCALLTRGFLGDALGVADMISIVAAAALVVAVGCGSGGAGGQSNVDGGTSDGTTSTGGAGGCVSSKEIYRIDEVAG
jgi:hypothetical protein